MLAASSSIMRWLAGEEGTGENWPLRRMMRERRRDVMMLLFCCFDWFVVVFFLEFAVVGEEFGRAVRWDLYTILTRQGWERICWSNKDGIAKDVGCALRSAARAWSCFSRLWYLKQWMRNLRTALRVGGESQCGCVGAQFVARALENT